jgi:oxygen-independent coproporphyrinogen III oxidase
MEKERYADAALSEMQLRMDYLDGETISTIYFGGGTPSLLSVADIRRMIDEVQALFTVDKLAEITLEANPDELTFGYLEKIAALGVNRISVGIQSFHDTDLHYLGRTHTAKQALHVLDELLEGPIQDISADLIYGIPTLTNEHWKRNLEILTRRRIKHISAYALTVEQKTPLQHYINKGTRSSPDELQAALQFEMLMDIMEAKGYTHYEISNFCLPGHHSKHNSAYWQGVPYLGIGPSAHSYNGNSRQWNCSNLTDYLAAIEAKKVPCETEILTRTDRYNEYIMTGVRTSGGIDFRKLTDIFGDALAAGFLLSAEAMIKNGWIEKDNGSFLLTRSGKLFADRVAAELFLVNTD